MARHMIEGESDGLEKRSSFALPGLVEFELIRRRTLLALTVALPIVGVILALVGESYIGGAFGTGAVASGAAAIPRRSDPAIPRRSDRVP